MWVGIPPGTYFKTLVRECQASVVELADAPDSKSGSERSVGSSPTGGTYGNSRTGVIEPMGQGLLSFLDWLKISPNRKPHDNPPSFYPSRGLFSLASRGHSYTGFRDE